jgi:Glycogen recognition site of AMP-activated protein kinase
MLFRLSCGTIFDTHLLERIGKAAALRRYVAKTVSVAGSFNEWTPNLTNFTMKKVSDRKFELAVPIAQFEKGKIYQFKFVLDGTNWQDPPFEAKNTSEEGGHTNLSLRL